MKVEYDNNDLQYKLRLTWQLLNVNINADKGPISFQCYDVRLCKVMGYEIGKLYSADKNGLIKPDRKIFINVARKLNLTCM